MRTLTLAALLATACTSPRVALPAPDLGPPDLATVDAADHVALPDLSAADLAQGVADLARPPSPDLSPDPSCGRLTQPCCAVGSTDAGSTGGDACPGDRYHYTCDPQTNRCVTCGYSSQECCVGTLGADCTAPSHCDYTGLGGPYYCR